MAVVFEKDKAYMEALKVFRRLIERDYQEGGWLPPSREMAGKLGVSSVTYVKVTNRLVSESMAASYPRKGIYITPKRYRPRKIGLVINGGEESPFIDGNLLTAVLQKIDKAGFDPQLIQGSPVTTIPRNALAHCVQGLIWVAPPAASYPVIQQIQAEELLPQVMVMTMQPGSEADLPPAGIPAVSEDYQAMGTKMADFFIDRHHQSVLYLGDAWFAEHIGLADRLRAAGLEFDPTHCLGDSMPKSSLLTQLLKTHRATGLIVEGREKRLEAVFAELSDLPDSVQPEVLVRDCSGLAQICQAHPRVKVIGVARERLSKGAAAAEMLTAHLATGKEMQTRTVESYQIEKKEMT